jgi:hypothetical protein
MKKSTRNALPVKSSVESKKTYSTPVLSKYGNISAQTQGGAPEVNDPNGAGSTGGKSGF